MPDISYLLYLDDEALPLEGNVTLGNHLDNDVVVPGEDVTDYHLRIELSDRGPVLVPLGESTINVNGQEHAKPVQVIIGDVIGIGQTTLQIGVEQEHPPQGERWALYASDGSLTLPIEQDATVGRADECDLVLANEHISRTHARLVIKHNVVWVQDLNSANGTGVNGTPIVGGVRLFHGDMVDFDRITFQLIGEGADLTPVKQPEEPSRGVALKPPDSDGAAPNETTEFLPVDENALDLRPVELPQPLETGAYLLGISDSVENDTFRLVVGRNVIGRSPECYLTLPDNTVSAEHAEIMIRPEGATITNLMSTNGTRVNSHEISSSELHDGDVIRLGRVSLMFKNIPPTLEDHPILGKLRMGILIGLGLVGLALVTIFLL